MWPFSNAPKKAKTMNPRRIDDQFSVTGQITPEHVETISDMGFKAIVCARPDNEEGGQPSFAEVARAAELQGLQIVHIPVSGAPTVGQIARFHEAMGEIPRPVLGYCRSGARAGSLYATLPK